MGFLPSPDIDLSKFSQSELQGLKNMLEIELSKSKARQAHIDALLAQVAKYLS